MHYPQPATTDQQPQQKQRQLTATSDRNSSELLLCENLHTKIQDFRQEIEIEMQSVNEICDFRKGLRTHYDRYIQTLKAKLNHSKQKYESVPVPSVDKEGYLFM